MTTIRRVHREIDILTPDEVRALMAACSRRAPTGVRHRALIALLYGSGLRISEALSLRPKDIDLDALTVTVHSGKGDKRGVSALLPDAVDAIARWADVRARFGVGAREPLFCTVGRGAAGSHPTAPGRRLGREYVARVLKRLARRIGLAKRVHAHGFRHSFADLLRRRGFDVEEIRRQLRHASLEITGRYLDHLGPGDLPQRIREIGSVLDAPTDARAELGDLLSRLGAREIEQMVALLKQARA
jgi:integrase/recombinase XerC